MRSMPPILPVLLLTPLAACASDPWREWPVADVAMSDLAITRVGWDRGQATDPGADGSPRYTWVVDIQNGSGTIWSGEVRVIAELESGGQVHADTLTEQVVVPGRRVITVTDFGRLTAGASTDGLMPRFQVRIGAYCATIEGESGSAAPCPEEPAVAPPTDAGPPIP